MLKIISVILLLGMLIQSFSRQVIFTEFLLNRDFITKALCVNKEEKVNLCQGKCHLKKQLQQDNERQEKNNQQVKSNVEVLFSQNDETVSFQNYPVESKFLFVDLITTSIKGHTSGIFHPPSC